MLKKDRRSINNKYLKKQIILAVIIIIYILSLTFISARYALKKVDTYLSSSKEFYFYSDKLTTNETDEAYIVQWPVNEECVIPINLYTKLNSLKKAEYKIAYSIECNNASEGLNYKLSKTEGVIEPEKDNVDAFTLSVSSNSKIKVGDTFTIAVSVKTIDAKVNDEDIEAYDKELNRNFKIQVVDSDEVTCRIEDKEERAYLNLIVTTKSEEIVIEFEDEELIFDNTNDIFKRESCYDEDNDGYIDKIKVSENATIKFIKRARQDFYTSVDLQNKGNNIFKIIKKDVNR